MVTEKEVTLPEAKAVYNLCPDVIYYMAAYGYTGAPLCNLDNSLLSIYLFTISSFALKEKTKILVHILCQAFNKFQCFYYCHGQGH